MSVSGLPKPSVAPPALFTRMSIAPNSASVASTIALTDAESVTSQMTARQRRPFLVHQLRRLLDLALRARGGDDVRAGLGERERPSRGRGRGRRR